MRPRSGLVQPLSDLRVTDGGVYDNLGLEPVWKDHCVVLVSDAGGLMDADDDGGLFWRVKRYQSIQERQALVLRRDDWWGLHRGGECALAVCGGP